MPKSIILLTFITVCTFFGSCYAEDLGTLEQVRYHIDKMLAAAPQNANIGVVVQDMENGQTIYQHNANRLYIPASTLKTVTTTAALLYLGKNFQFKTTLTANQAKPIKGVLKGNVYVVFHGDPTLTSTDLKQLAQQLKSLGVKTITGNVYLVNYLFTGNPYGHGWMWDDLNNCFSAPLHAMNINHNCFKVKLIAGTNAGDPTHIQEVDDTVYTPIKNLSRTVKKVENHDPVSCPLDADIDDNNHYTISGCIKPNAARQLDFAILHVDAYAKSIVSNLFQNADIKVKGHYYVTEQNVAGKYTLATHKSEPLSQYIKVMLDRSDNLYADALLKTLGAKYYNTQGDWRNGIMAIKAILLTKAHLNFNKVHIVDGAGLSRYNLITPNDYAKLLQFNFLDNKIGGTFLQALPVAGVQGGLPRLSRAGTPIILRNVRAKTGTMEGVLGIVGYFHTRTHRVYSFVFLINNFTGKVYPFFFLETDIIEYLVKTI